MSINSELSRCKPFYQMPTSGPYPSRLSTALYPIVSRTSETAVRLAAAGSKRGHPSPRQPLRDPLLPRTLGMGRAATCKALN
ncbi:hypothetical protein J6590_053500 [Homalodisca vitripennis]|nr:hypothetical protein J6590_053500 [Homalodisca vitripennis]